MPQPQGKDAITLSMYDSPVKNGPYPVEKIHNLHGLVNMLQKGTRLTDFTWLL